MHLKVSYDSNFDDLMLHMRSKYPEKLFDLDGIGKQLDLSLFSKDFFSTKTTTADVSVDANANMDDMSVIVYNTEVHKPLARLNSYYILWKYLKKLYGHETANKIIELQITGAIYVNDCHGIAASMAYCFNYSTYDIMLLGLPMVSKIKSSPPKHLYAFKSQLEQFVVIASNSTLGATGLADLFIVMSYYVRNILANKSDAHFNFATEADCWSYIKENIVSFIYTINQPLRAAQSPFTNVSVYDREFLGNLCPTYVFPDGSTPDIHLVSQLQELYLDVMNEELRRTPVTFPITSACFAVDNDNNLLDESFAEVIAIKNLEYGFINIYCGKSSTLSSCCRLRSETDNEYFNSFGSGSSKIGSLGVVSINLPRLAFKHSSTTQADFIAELEELVGVCSKINNAKRHVVKRRIDSGNLPLYSLGFMELSKQYSTVGVNGLNECCEILGYSILDDAGQEFALSIINSINKVNDRYQKQYKTPHNCEQIPGESVSVKLAAKDALLGYNDTYEIYSNQFIPLTTQADLLDRIRLQGLFDKHFSGGAICHLNIEQRINDPKKLVALIKSCAKAGVIYHAVNYSIQLCANGHMTVGRRDTCECGSKITDTFSRVVGFLVNVKHWNKTRRELDFPNRQWYSGV